MKLSELDGTRHWYGFLLSLLTALMWGILPIFLKLCLEAMDPVTITLYRFLFAAFVVYLLLLKNRSLPRIKALGRGSWGWLMLAALLLAINYVANVKGLEYLNPETAQVVMQVAPFMLMLGGVVFFKERLSRFEIFGASLLIIGLLLFFNDRLADLLTSLSDYTTGVLVIVFAATTWAGYALMQKLLLRVLTAKQLTLLIYLIGASILLPFTNLQLIWDMQIIHLFALLFCCVNTLVAYGAFTEALNVWQASKVSAVLASSPIFTFVSMLLAVELWPSHFTSSALDHWAYLGAGVVILGSMITALGKAKLS